MVKVRTIPKPIKKKKSKRKNAPNEAKALKEILLRLWSINIYQQWNGICGACGKAGNNAHHFFGKGAYPSVKYDLDNGVLLCFGCHIFKVHRKNQTEIARDALINKIGDNRFNELKKRANSVRRYKLPDLLALKAELSKLG